MTRYCVNATLTAPAWIYVDADSPEEAMDEAREQDARHYEFDHFSSEIEFNVTPAVEVEPA